VTYRCPRCGQEIAVDSGRIVEHWELEQAVAGCYPKAYPVTLVPIDGSSAPRSEVYPVCPYSGARVVWT
jgi:hypothetical protein